MSKSIIIVVSQLVFVFGTSVLAAADQKWAPTKSVEIVIPSGPGGSFDRTGRTVQSLFQTKNLVDQSTVVNKAGGAGGLALNYLSQHANDPHYLVIGSSSTVANYLTGGNAYNYLELTPISLLLNDYVAFAVPVDSSLKTGQQALETLRKDPGALSIAIGTALGGSAHIAFAHAMKSAGVDVRRLKVVAFKSGGASLSAVLGGHVDLLASSPGNVARQAKAGKLRVLAISSPKRLQGVLSVVPTWRELGVDSVYANWRGVAASRGISKSQIEYWNSVFGELVKTAEWREQLERNYWGGDYLNSAAFSSFLKKEYAVLESLLTELSLVKK